MSKEHFPIARLGTQKGYRPPLFKRLNSTPAPTVKNLVKKHPGATTFHDALIAAFVCPYLQGFKAVGRKVLSPLVPSPTYENRPLCVYLCIFGARVVGSDVCHRSFPGLLRFRIKEEEPPLESGKPPLPMIGHRSRNAPPGEGKLGRPTHTALQQQPRS